METLKRSRILMYETNIPSSLSPPNYVSIMDEIFTRVEKQHQHEFDENLCLIKVVNQGTYYQEDHRDRHLRLSIMNLF